MQPPPTALLGILLLKLSGPLLTVPDIRSGDIVQVNRVVEARLDKQPTVPVGDHGDAAIAAAAEPRRVLRCELHLKRFQAAFLRVIE